jgi:hypothetical protein
MPGVHEIKSVGGRYFIDPRQLTPAPMWILAVRIERDSFPRPQATPGNPLVINQCGQAGPFSSNPPWRTVLMRNRQKAARANEHRCL